MLGQKWYEKKFGKMTAEQQRELDALMRELDKFPPEDGWVAPGIYDAKLNPEVCQSEDEDL